MKIVVAGGTGFIGEALVAVLAQQHDVVVLSRQPERVNVGRGVAWDPAAHGGPWEAEITDAEAVVNLAGAGLADGRWTESRKRILETSRLTPTGALVSAIRRSRSAPLFLSASAVGIYGSRGNEVLTEDSDRGEGFLAELAERWEAAAKEAEDRARVVLLRFGVVLASGGGALERMALPFRLFAGGPISTGHQWMSWVDRGDLVRAIEFALSNGRVEGTYNVTSPEPVRNRDFARAMGAVLRRPALLPVPGFILELLFGQMARETLLVSQRVVPRRLLDAGFEFQFGAIEDSLRHALG